MYSFLMSQRLAESFEAALRVAGGRALAVEMSIIPGNESAGQSPKEHLFNAKFSCPVCSYSIQELEPRLLENAESEPLLLWDGAGRPFHPHEIDYRTEGDKELLYVVNHLPEHDAVMVFQLKNRRVELLHQFDSPGRGLHDLAAVGDGRFYATVDHLPLNSLVNRLGDYMRLPLGTVEYFDGSRFRRVGKWIGFANGVAASSDGQMRVVASMLAGKVLVSDRDASGDLPRRTAIAVPGNPDNLNWMNPVGDCSALG